MRAGSLLFAAGRGTRLRPFTDLVPKPALPVLDLPLASWGLAALARNAPPVVTNASHLADSVAAALASRPERSEMSLEAPAPLGTGGTLRHLRDRVEDALFTWNADTVADVDIAALARCHRADEAQATLAVVRVPERADFEVRAGRVARLVDRRAEDISGFRFIGVALYARSGLDLLGDRTPLGATEGLLLPLIDRGALAVFEHEGYARDVGTLEDYLSVSLDLLEGSTPELDPGPPGEVVAVEGGHAYLGPGASAAPESIGPGAIVLAGSSVGDGARVVRSIVWPGERVPENADLSDCVWFRGSALPAQM